MEEEKLIKAVALFGTPMFLYDEIKILEQLYILRNAIFSKAKLFYAMKANPLIGICQLLYSNGCGIETASKGEIQTALKAGVKAENIIFTSPGKTEEEITYAINKQIKLLNVESLEEARIIDDIAREKETTVKIGLRINQNVNFSKAKMKMTGVSSQFGIEESELSKEFFDKLQALKNIEIVGFQVYSGTQVLDAEEILQNVEYIINMVLNLSKSYQISLKYLNLGGGFGVPYFKGELPLDMSALKQGMEKLEAQYGRELEKTEIIFESGRFLVAESGLFVTKILYRKVSKDMLYYVCDGGSNFHSSTAFMGRFVRNNFPMYSIPDIAEKKKVNVVGPLCTPTDLIGKNVELSGELNPGDLIVVVKSGAYGLSYSPFSFLSHESPMEVLKIGDTYEVLRERGMAEDLWIRQKGLGYADV